MARGLGRFHFLASLCLIIGLELLGCGPGAQEKDRCQSAEECGATGDALCLAGDCFTYEGDSDFGSASLNLSFGRDGYRLAASAFVYFFHQEKVDGSRLNCGEFIDFSVAETLALLNPLVAEPKYLVFNWQDGGTFFPNIPVLYVRPSAQVLVVVEGWSQLEGQGIRSAVGCTSDLSLGVGQVLDGTVSVEATW